MQANLRLYPWFKFCQGLLFWQAVWFLFFQERLSAAEAILLYAVYDIATTALEVPSGWMSDRIGRRTTLILASVATLIGASLLLLGGAFWVYALAQVALGAGAAFASGTDSSLLFESLREDGRDDEIETHEVLAWRASFAGLALSAITGGALSLWDPLWPFVATVIASVLVMVLTLRFREPSRHAAIESLSFKDFTACLRQPVLAWCFVLALSMYVFSHVPFVFGQPVILETLSALGLAAEAPLVSGAVTTAMMVVSLGASLFAPGLRRALGLGGILLLALGMQVGLILGLALWESVLVIALLLLRMVPDALAKPFLMARIQPLLSDSLRATYLSMQSFCGRLALAGSLMLLSSDASTEGAMAHAEIQAILVWYIGAGVAVLTGLALTLWAVRDAPRPAQ